MTLSDNLVSKLVDLNEIAISMIENDQFESALDELRKAEALLLPFGKTTTLDQTYTLTVFYNSACCYQKLNQLYDCSSYL